MKFATDELRAVTILAGLPEWQLAWFSEHGDRTTLATGQRMFERGQPADFMFIVVKGAIKRYEEIGGQWLVVATTREGQVTGMLPYSRMTRYPGYTVAAEPSEVLRLRKEHFQEMLLVSHEIGRRLVASMADRVRADVRLEQQHDRLIALGRLSAGLAHELNNPAAAIRRGAGHLSGRRSSSSRLVLNLMRHGVDDQATHAIEEDLRAASEHSANALSELERSEREETLGVWLDARSVPDAWSAAGAFVEAGIERADLERLSGQLPAAAATDAISWMADELETARMIDEIGAAAARITELISAIKAYSQMDRSHEQRPTDIRDGLASTLTMLSHRFKEKSIRLTCDFQQDLPVIAGSPGDLNQVWTNLIDNALDAMSDGGALRVEARREDVWLAVRIIDDGQGIPEELRHQIFEPFFTTKAPGQGTGLGLDIAMRIVNMHQGSIEVQSRPGRTEVSLRFPATPSQEPSPQPR